MGFEIIGTDHLQQPVPPVDMVNHPPHYGNHPSGMECIEVTRLMSFNLGNAVKYIWRYDAKNGVQDLRKAAWYLKDNLKYGLPRCPPFRARERLCQAADMDTDMQRATMLYAIGNGQLEDVIGLIEDLTNDV